MKESNKRKGEDPPTTDEVRTKQPKSMEEISYNVPVFNKWGALEESNEHEDKMEEEVTIENQNEKKKVNMPPIVITMAIADINACNLKVKQVLGTEDYTIKYGPKETKILTYSKTAYEKMMNELKKDNAHFFTYRNRQEREKKVVLKGAPNMDINIIKMQLNAEGANVIECKPMKGRSTNTSSYLITTTKDTNIGQIKKK